MIRDRPPHFPIPTVVLALLLLAILNGCASLQLPDVDLEEETWQVRQGQAVWKANADAPPIAGDLLIAKDNAGNVFISFSKGPVPVFTARSTADGWLLDLAVRGKSFSRRGNPPKRFIWFAVPALLDGAPPPKGWTADKVADDEWMLEKPKNGETVRLILDL